MMTHLAFYISAIKNGTSVVYLSQERKKDISAEVERTVSLWRHENGVIIRCIREDELLPDTYHLCPECWILWEVVDACGMNIRPIKKNFHNTCQEAFWLGMQPLEN